MIAMSEASSQTNSVDRKERIATIKANQDTLRYGKPINNYKMNQLAKMNIPTEKLDLNSFKDRKQVNLLFEVRKDRDSHLANAIVLNVIGTMAMAVGGSAIHTANVNYPGNNNTFGKVFGSISLGFGSVLNVGSVPLYVVSALKAKKFRAMKENLVAF